LREVVNPLLVLARVMEAVSGWADSFHHESWKVFSRHVAGPPLGGGAVKEAEELARRFAAELATRPPILMLESGVLLYFVLKSGGVLERHGEGLVKPLLEFIKRECLEFHRLGLVTLEGSPLLSRCLGLSYALLDEMDAGMREVLESLAAYCDNPDLGHLYFCMHAAFAVALRATANREGRGAVCRWTFNLYRGASKAATLENLAWLLMVVGLTRRLGCGTERLALPLMHRLAARLAMERKSLPWRGKATWRTIILALKLNGLEKLSCTTPQTRSGFGSE